MITNLKGKVYCPDISSLQKIMKINKCQLCDSKYEKCELDCGDKICELCLSKLDTLKCPYCRKELTGGKMSDNLRRKIYQNEHKKLNELKEIDEYIAKILFLNPKYNINSLYDKNL